MRALKIAALNKHFGKRSKRVQAVKALDLDVAEGEAFGFIGANGAGKSTTIKMIMDIIRPDSGVIEVFGTASVDRQARLGVSYVPENPYLYDYMTPREILQMAVLQHGLKVPDVKAHCMHWLEVFDIAHAANKRVRNLSKGMTQRTALAHALVSKPRMLILDEPLSGLDPIGRKDVVDVLRAYRETGGTLFFTSHVLHDVESIADHYGLIAKGELVVERSAMEIARDSPLLTLEVLCEGALEGYTHQGKHRWLRDIAREDLWAELKRLELLAVQILAMKPKLNLEAVFLEHNRSAA